MQPGNISNKEGKCEGGISCGLLHPVPFRTPLPGRITRCVHLSLEVHLCLAKTFPDLWYLCWVQKPLPWVSVYPLQNCTVLTEELPSNEAKHGTWNMQGGKNHSILHHSVGSFNWPPRNCLSKTSHVMSQNWEQSEPPTASSDWSLTLEGHMLMSQCHLVPPQSVRCIYGDWVWDVHPKYTIFTRKAVHFQQTSPSPFFFHYWCSYVWYLESSCRMITHFWRVIAPARLWAFLLQLPRSVLASAPKNGTAHDSLSESGKHNNVCHML